jgi:hypothetical protein
MNGRLLVHCQGFTGGKGFRFSFSVRDDKEFSA